MSDITVLGIDLAKKSFQLHGLDAKGNTVFKKAMSPSKADVFIANLKPCLIGMEACGGANFQARKYQSLGHNVKIIAPQFVKPFVCGNRNDISDAEGIAEAVSRPSIRCVPIKTEESQNLQNYHSIRDRLIKNKVALANQIRGILYEYNIKIPKGDKRLKSRLIELSEDSAINRILKEQIADFYQEFIELEEKIEKVTKKIEIYAKNSLECKMLDEIPGVGLLIASAIFAKVAQAKEFKNGRQFAAWLGLVPGHRQTGGPNGKKTMLGITKRGDRYLRKMIVQGARCLLISAHKRQDKMSQWACKLKAEKGFNKAAIALANKIARIMWIVLARGDNFDLAKA